MNTKEIIALLQLTQGATIIGARYLSGGQATYHFKDSLGIDPRVGDLVIVQTKEHYAVVEVVELNVPAHSLGCEVSALKNVVQLVDLYPLERLEQAEAQASHELAMSEVNERLAAFKATIGGTSFAKVSALFAPQEVFKSQDTPGDPGSDGFGA